MEVIYKKIGNRIRYFRNKKGMSQFDLANKLDVTQAYVYQIEKGKIRLNIGTLLKIAEVLEVPVHYLAPEIFDDKKEMNKDSPKKFTVEDIPKYFTIDDIIEWFKKLPDKEKKALLSRFIQFV